MPYSDEEMARYDTYVLKLKEATEAAKGKIKSLGKLDSGLELYRIDVNPAADQAMCIGATMHGNEQSGAYGVIEYLKTYPVPEDTHLIVLPLINPHGLLKNTRHTEGKFDLNRSFRAKVPPAETKMVKDALATEQIKYLVSLHEDSDSDDFYAYVPDAVKPAELRSLMKVVEKHFPIKPDGKYREETTKGGTISFSDADSCSHNWKSFEYWVRKTYGCPYVCTEVPTKFAFAERVACVQQFLRWCVEKHFQKIRKKV